MGYSNGSAVLWYSYGAIFDKRMEEQCCDIHIEEWSCDIPMLEQCC